MEKYFIYLQDDECDELVDKALVSYAKTLTDNTIFIPCFDGYEQWPLVEIFREENSKMGAYEMYHSKDIHFGSIVDDYQLTDARVCHMTKRNNEIFAEKIIQAIKEKNFSFKFKKEDYITLNELEIKLNYPELLDWFTIKVNLPRRRANRTNVNNFNIIKTVDFGNRP